MNFYQNWCLKKANIKVERLSKFYEPNDTVLDVGSGNCALSILLRDNGIDITSLDIVNKSAFEANSSNNWEFFGHPHTNKSDEEWKHVFNELRLVIKESEYYDFLLFFKQVTYILME